MGMTLLIQCEPEPAEDAECPDPFPETDSKNFLRTMFGPAVEVLEYRLNLDLTPLKHCAVFVDSESEEELGPEWAEEARRNSELAWHPPEAFIASLAQLVARLEESERKLPTDISRAIDPSGDDYGYYQSPAFFSDVTGCLAAIRQLQEQGAKRVRFFAY